MPFLIPSNPLCGWAKKIFGWGKIPYVLTGTSPKAMGEGQGRQIYHNGSGTKKKRLVVTFIIRKLISFLKRCFPSGEITRSSQSFFGHDAMMTPNQGQELDAIFFRVFNASHFQFHFEYRAYISLGGIGRDADPGWGPRYPPGTPPRGGIWRRGIEHSKPRDTGDFIENPLGGFWGLFIGMMCGSK